MCLIRMDIFPLFKYQLINLTYHGMLVLLMKNECLINNIIFSPKLILRNYRFDPITFTSTSLILGSRLCLDNAGYIDTSL